MSDSTDLPSCAASAAEDKERQSHAEGKELGETTPADQAKARGLREQGLDVPSVEPCKSAADTKLEAIPACDVASGIFKYVQVHALAGDGTVKVIVRSAPGEFHADVAEELCDALSAAGIKYSIPGGGRIRRDDAKKEIDIYGFSKGFGLPDHSLTAKICAEVFPGYAVSHRDTGY
mmetsp:Transcript_119863/g.217762  ORF Transcript_119863/g.217762 Transcript_119863/m.217762 type:complete len:176 (-) Transcript_119863:223-750(-)